MPLCLGTVGVGAHVELTPVGEVDPRLFQVFCPLRTNVSPSSTAVVRSDARSEPASGSDIPWDQISSPRSMGLRKRCFCSSVPYVMIAGAMLDTPITLIGPGAPAALISSR